MDLHKDKSIQEIIRLLGADTPVHAEGTWGSFAPLLAQTISQHLKRPILFITPHIDNADNAADDLTIFANRPIETLPAWEASPQFADATDEIGAQRMTLTLELASRNTDPDLIISTSILALIQPVPAPNTITQRGLNLTTNQTIKPDLIINWLIDNNFERTDAVDLPGQFAHRGGIIDIFAPITQQQKTDSSAKPVRIEFFSDQIESIRTVNLDTQRSADDINSITVIPPIGYDHLDRTELFINLLPPETIIILSEPLDIQETADVFLDRIDDIKGLYPFAAIDSAIKKFTTLSISRFGVGKNNIKLPITSAQKFQRKTTQLIKDAPTPLDELVKLTKTGKTVHLYCENSAEQKRLKEIITEKHGRVPKNLHTPIGFINEGFIIESLNTIIISHHEIFGQYSVRRRIRTIRRTSPIDSFLDLSPGDYIVHISYGIGKFKGIKQITKKDSTTEYLTLEYANKTLIHVPVSNISLVHKFVGSTPKRPKLSRIGTKAWEKQKEKVAQSVNELAAELLDLQAKRASAPGIAFNPDSNWQKEFDGSFLYTETPDQLTCIDQIKDDMTTLSPMDRLLCGDVGYGKTELAMRAAFKAVESGKQVAVLVPTTVLCVQHGRTFTERFADFPVTIEILNRFKTTSQARKIVEQTKLGKVDILIGTHRLLSSDVDFFDLGLLIIDEEQRFGVEHKERLKRLRANMDILTMTATPIPRTLHMSLLGLRDISSLSTPPLDRRAVVTNITRFDELAIKKAVHRELNRQGQVFFLHNRVQSIENMAAKIQKIVPDARLDIAHGQMTKRQLESAMIKFVRGETDVLVCTTIIESGLDIPNANTIFINDADRFGLAELHQLRGRVGRYKHRAYAYMLLPMSRPISPIAAKRLKAIEEYSELGAGFRIALRDLEIRGAGNILGAQQSGHIQAVGYEMYCKLLTNAVKRMKNEPLEPDTSAVINLGFSTYIPKDYIPSDRQRMSVYRRIADAKTIKDLKRLRAELDDLFGKSPKQMDMLIDLAEIRIKAAKWDINSIVARSPDLIFDFKHHETANKLFAKAPGKVRIPDPKTVHLRLTENYFEPITLTATLRKLL